jgi:hypothetical protein
MPAAGLATLALARLAKSADKQEPSADGGIPDDDSASAETVMIRKLKSGQFRLYSRKKNPKTGKRRNLGTFETRAAAVKHEQQIQFFKRRGGG